MDSAAEERDPVYRRARSKVGLSKEYMEKNGERTVS